MASTINRYIDLGSCGEIECQIEYDYTAGRPAVMYLRNGDPGYPADPEEIDIVKVSARGVDITDLLSDKSFLEDLIIEHEDSRDERADAWEANND